MLIFREEERRANGIRDAHALGSALAAVPADALLPCLLLLQALAATYGLGRGEKVSARECLRDFVK